MKGTAFKKITLLASCITLTVLSNGQTLQQAIQLTKNEQFEKADRAFKSLLAAQPTNGLLYFYEGENFFGWGMQDSAQAAYEKGIKLNATNALNYAGLGKVLWYNKKTDDANHNFYTAKTISKSKDPIVLNKIAEAYISAPNKDLKDALDLLNQSVLLDSKTNPDTYIDLGDAYLAQNPSDGSKPIEEYEKALSIDPKNVIAILREGVLYQRAKNYELSFNYFQKATQMDSTFAPAYREKAEMLYEAGQFDKAIAQYQKYLHLNDAVSARIRYGEFLFLAKKYDDAINEIQKVFAKDSSNVILYRVIAYSQYEKKDYKNGLTNITKFFAKAPTSGVKMIASDYSYYGKLLSKNGQDSLGVDKMNKAAMLMLASDGPTAEVGQIYSDIGLLYFQSSRYDKAVQYFQMRVKLPQATVNDYNYLGRAAFQNKQYQKSDSAFAVIVNARPDLMLGYLWRFYSNESVDSTFTGAAKPFADTYIQKVAGDTMKNTEGVIAAYSYYALCDIAKKDYEGAKQWWTRVKGIDPANAQAKMFFDSVKKQQQPIKKEEPKKGAGK